MSNKDFLNPDDNIDLTAGADEESMVLNLDEVNENPEFEVLAPGVYDCVIENTEFGKSSNGNPMITWIFKVTDPQYAGRLLYNHTTLNNEVGLGRLKKILARVLPHVSLAEFRPREFCDSGDALGYPCRVKVRIRPYEGKKRNNVQDVLAPADTGAGFLDE